MKNELCGKDESREVILLDPVAPHYPEPFFKRGITAVMGTRMDYRPRDHAYSCQRGRGNKKAAQMLRGKSSV